MGSSAVAAALEFSNLITEKEELHTRTEELETELSVAQSDAADWMERAAAAERELRQLRELVGEGHADRVQVEGHIVVLPDHHAVSRSASPVLQIEAAENEMDLKKPPAQASFRRTLRRAAQVNEICLFCQNAF